jgi:hypothetical protein
MYLEEKEAAQSTRKTPTFIQNTNPRTSTTLAHSFHKQQLANKQSENKKKP